MSIQQDLLQHPGLVLDQNVFYQKNLPRHLEFEKNYLALRQEENRIYSDDIVMKLPDIPSDSPLHTEWRIRKKSLRKLLRYLGRKSGTKTILEVGCGNGWLSRHLAAVHGAEVLGVDVNEQELLQGAALFKKHKNLTFAYADVSQLSLTTAFDYIILASSLQYFPDVGSLIEKLLALLNVSGEIHIIDSPLYKSSQLTPAKERSAQYFASHGSGMTNYYFHHDWKSLKPFRAELLYDPLSFFGRVKRSLSLESPFPWIRITRYAAH